MPATAICWSTYEFFKYIIERRGQEALIVSRRGDRDRESTALPPSPKDVFGIVPAVGASTSIVTTPSAASTAASGRELPAMSGAGMYGALQYNTIHQQSSSAGTATTMQMRRN